MDVKWLIATGIAVIGIAISVGVGFWQVYRRMPGEIAFDTRSVQLIGHYTKQALPPDVQILFKGRQVARIVAGTLTVWNRGHETLRRADLVDSDPLRIVLPQRTDVLGVQIEQRSRAVNGFRVDWHSPQPYIRLSFEFLDHTDGARITVLHSGPDEALSLEGTIMGQPTGPSFVPPPDQEDMEWPLIPTLIFFAAMTASGLIEVFYEGPVEIWAKVFAGLSLVILFGIFALMDRRFKRKAPVALRSDRYGSDEDTLPLLALPDDSAGS